MKIVCDACQAKYSIADDKIQGKAFKIRCKKCNHIIVVKVEADAAAHAAVSPAAAAERPRAAPASAAEQGVWHIVVDGEQVGPLTEGEVKDRLSQGKINSDTLVWKDGLGDWTALSAVPELAAIYAKLAQQHLAKPAGRPSALVAGGAKAAAAPSRVISPVAHAAPVAHSALSAHAGPAARAAAPLGDADVFAAPSVVSPSAASSLFGASAAAVAAPSPAAPSPSSAFLFGASPAHGPEPVVAKPPGNGAGGAHLTGQRNENSVLFSLSNLEALAMPSHSTGLRAPSGTSTTEGSGLIDIRSMAAMTLGDSGEVRRSADSLPSFSTPQFSPVAPVILPISSSGPPKWVYPVLGMLSVAILVVCYIIVKVVTAPPPGSVQVVVAPPPAPAPVAAPAAAPPPAAGGPAAAAPEAAIPAAAPPAAAAPTASPEAPAEKAEKGRASSGRGEKGRRKGSDQTASSKGSAEAKKGTDVAMAPPPAPAPAADVTKPPPSTTKPPSGRKGGKSIDDLLGEVGSRKGGDEGGAKAPAAAPAKLISLTKSDIVSAMKGVQPRVQACANQFKVPGTAMAQISVASGGRVNSASVTGRFAGTPTGACVEQAAKTAKFPPCQAMDFPWPFTLTPR